MNRGSSPMRRGGGARGGGRGGVRRGGRRGSGVRGRGKFFWPWRDHRRRYPIYSYPYIPYSYYSYPSDYYGSSYPNTCLCDPDGNVMRQCMYGSACCSSDQTCSCVQLDANNYSNYGRVCRNFNPQP